MKTIKIKLNKDEDKIVSDYCFKHGITKEDAFKTALLEIVEDELDLAEYEAAKKKYNENPVSYSLEEVRKELGLK